MVWKTPPGQVKMPRNRVNTKKYRGCPDYQALVHWA